MCNWTVVYSLITIFARVRKSIDHESIETRSCVWGKLLRFLRVRVMEMVCQSTTSVREASRESL